MKTKCLILLLMLTLTPVRNFAQECPCIKTALIGTNANAPVAHNNSVTAMDDREITRGESVELVTKEHAGAIAWYITGTQNRKYSMYLHLNRASISSVSN